jgi:fucose permease
VTAPTAIRASLLVLAYFAFISLGLPDGLLGVGWPSMHLDLGVSTDAVGFLLFAGTAGYLTSSVLAGFALRRLGVGRLLAGSTALAGLALIGYGVSPALWFTVPCALFSGFAGGAIDAGLNAYAANAFGPRHMNWLHACFGLGTTIGPIIMTTVLGTGNTWRWGYAIVATAELALAVAFAVSARSWTAHRPEEAHHSQGGARQVFRLPALWISVLAFGVYVAIEVGTGLWAYLLLTHGRGVSATVGGLCVSAYWGALFVGRVIQGVFAGRFDTHRVLLTSLIGMVAGALLVAVPGFAPITVLGLVIIGFSAAPVFPLLTLTTAERVGAGHADRAIGMQIAGSGLGGALIPSGIGVLLSDVTVDLLGPALAVLSVVLLGLYGVLRRPKV